MDSTRGPPADLAGHSNSSLPLPSLRVHASNINLAAPSPTEQATDASSANTTSPQPSDLVTDTPTPTKFMGLAVELREKIWALARPEPAIIMQVDSKSIVGGYHYIRSGPPVPALLHTCRESRYEYIEVEDPEDESQKTLPRRRSAHPVYKLCFAGTGRSTRKAKKGVYMELNWDTLWATPTLNSPMAGLQHRFSGLMVISRSRFADRLTSLTLSPYTILDKELQLLLSRFTALKTLTMLVTKDLLRLNGYETSKVVIPAENNNQLDLQALINHHIIGPGTYSLVNWQNHQIQIFQAYSSAHPGQTMPELLWRFEEQLLEKEGFTFPALEEEDPLKYMELEMAETDRLRQASKRQAERESMVEGSSKKRKAMLRPM